MHDVALAGEMRGVIVLVQDGDGEINGRGSRLCHTRVLRHQGEVVALHLLAVQLHSCRYQARVRVHEETPRVVT